MSAGGCFRLSQAFHRMCVCRPSYDSKTQDVEPRIEREGCTIVE